MTDFDVSSAGLQRGVHATQLYTAVVRVSAKVKPEYFSMLLG